MRLLSKPLGIAFSIILFVTAGLFGIGTLRYGNPHGLWMRVQTEITQRQPHPNFAPTPLESSLAIRPVSLIDPSQAIAQATKASTPLPTRPKQSDASGDALLPTVTPTPMPAPPTATPAPLHIPAQPAVRLTGFSHEWQTWNNCGPDTLAMNLSYYGSQLNQTIIGTALRTHEDDKNVHPIELADYARQQGFQALIGVDGNINLLRTLLSNGFPVIIETWFEDKPNDGMGHYRMLVGYEDVDQRWIAYDSYVSHDLINPNGEYQGIILPYAETETLWEVFNRLYLVVYTAEQEPLLRSIVGADFDPNYMWQRALQHAYTIVQAQPNNPYAWFNLGSDWLRAGNAEQAAIAYDQARRLGLPWRMLWYQYGPFDAYYQMGRYQEVVSLADATLRNTKSIEEIYAWQGRALSALGKRDAARTAWRRAAALNPAFTVAE